jgi:hypothetical protein
MSGAPGQKTQVDMSWVVPEGATLRFDTAKTLLHHVVFTLTWRVQSHLP